MTSLDPAHPHSSPLTIITPLTPHSLTMITNSLTPQIILHYLNTQDHKDNNNDYIHAYTECTVQWVSFAGENLREFHISVAICESFLLRKSIFKQLDTALVGVVHWVTANSQKFSQRKSIFKQFSKVFSHERNPLYVIIYIHNYIYIYSF